MIYIGKLEDGRAILYYDEKYAIESGEPYIPYEEDDIPEGNGLLMTDLETLWWEPLPDPEPVTPDPEPEDITSTEMASAIMEGVNNV